MKIQLLLDLIRVKHWIKNSVIILPLFFAGEILHIERDTIISLGLTFVAFSFTSSLIYILNDLKDVEKDRLHPVKRNRPIASNLISVKHALTVFSVILIIDVFLLLCLKPLVTGIIISYWVLNLFYIYYTKNISIIDIVSISSGFILRIFAGGMAVDVFISHWIVIMIFLLMFSIGLAKRKDDLIVSEEGSKIFRNSQKGYNKQFIDISMVFSFTITMMTYILYTVSHNVIERFQNEYMYITSLPVLLGILRYLQLSIVEEQTGSPVELLFSDRMLKGVIGVWLLVFCIVLYV